MKKLKLLSLTLCAALLIGSTTGSTTASASNGNTETDRPTVPVHILDTDTSYEDEIAGVQDLENIHIDEPGIETNDILGDVEKLFKISSTTHFPYNAICKITAYWNLDGGKQELGEGTGFLIAPNIVITAGHCLFDRTYGLGYCDKVDVIPGQSGTIIPYGKYKGCMEIVSYGWFQYGTYNDDWGVIKLEEPVISWVSKFFTLDPLTSNPKDPLNTMSVFVTGYPFEKPNNIKYGDYMWRSGGTVMQSDCRKIFYDCDTVGGLSGAPVTTSSDKVVAINAHNPYSIYKYNSGIRVTQDLIDDINSKIAQLD